ncbi:MAG: polysaccharide deacetylase family protein [Betaproteobacteria bacterium]|nr:polysaccharide deacetylase family protein [Betaproteobacteria bacterium]
MSGLLERFSLSAGNAAKRALEWALPRRFVVQGGGHASGIALTFDDGPHPQNTPRILDCLDHLGAKATFFVQGAMAKAHPGVVKDAARRGHRIGNHGYHHHSARAVPVSKFVADIQQCQSLLQDLLGSDASLDFRPPYGHLTPGTLWAMMRCEFRIVFWSIDSRDSFVQDGNELARSIARIPLRASEVMLFHDDYAHTVQALPAILADLQSRGCTFSRLDDARGIRSTSMPRGQRVS